MYMPGKLQVFPALRALFPCRQAPFPRSAKAFPVRQAAVCPLNLHKICPAIQGGARYIFYLTPTSVYSSIRYLFATQ